MYHYANLFINFSTSFYPKIWVDCYFLLIKCLYMHHARYTRFSHRVSSLWSGWYWSHLKKTGPEGTICSWLQTWLCSSQCPAASVLFFCCASIRFPCFYFPSKIGSFNNCHQMGKWVDSRFGFNVGDYRSRRKHEHAHQDLSSRQIWAWALHRCLHSYK